MEETNRKEAQQRRTHCVGHKHNVYRMTRCTSTAQEEQSALPAGCINTFEDSEDDAAYTGEQKEIERECQELRAIESWTNQEGWDIAAEGRAISTKTGKVIELRRSWEEVKRKLQSTDPPSAATRLDPDKVNEEYDLQNPLRISGF